MSILLVQISGYLQLRRENNACNSSSPLKQCSFGLNWSNQLIERMESPLPVYSV